MSTMSEREKIEALKEIIRSIHRGASIEELKKKYGQILSRISPFEIPLIEQQLVNEGMPVSEILKLCDLHVELFREHLMGRSLSGVPEGHPLDLLVRENEHILRYAEVLSTYAGALLKAGDEEARRRILGNLRDILGELRKIRTHYRKNQMLIFPYLERRGIVAVPRVLWGREDQVIVKLRELYTLLEQAEREPEKYAARLAEEAVALSREIGELVFRENKILYPATWALFSEGEWAAIHEIAKDIGYIVELTAEWKPSAKPVLPYEISGEVTEEQVERLPPEFRAAALKTMKPDPYRVRRKGDLELETGFVSKEELEAIFKVLPIELTYADAEDRVRLFTKNLYHKGFPRTKTILSRRIEFCHPPRLEHLVRSVVDDLKAGKYDHREFWTRQGDRILRVLIAAVRGRDGEYLGTLEIVEDLTDVVNNPEEVKKRIMVL